MSFSFDKLQVFSSFSSSFFFLQNSPLLLCFCRLVEHVVITVVFLRALTNWLSSSSSSSPCDETECSQIYLYAKHNNNERSTNLAQNIKPRDQYADAYSFVLDNTNIFENQIFQNKCLKKKEREKIQTKFDCLHL